MEDNLKIFKDVKRVFHNHINKYKSLKDKINRCCDKDIQKFLINVGFYLNKEYPEISKKDIYIALIYTYYILNLVEPIEKNYMNKTVYRFYADNVDNVDNLILKITTGSIPTNNGHNYASIIRRDIFGMNRKKTTTKSTSNSKTKKSRRHRA